jgi:hypothetical protein
MKLEEWSWIAGIVGVPVMFLTWLFKPKEFVAFCKNRWDLIFAMIVAAMLISAWIHGWFNWLVSAFSGLALLGLIGWIRFFRVRRKLRSFEKEFVDFRNSLVKEKMVMVAKAEESEISPNAWTMLVYFYKAEYELSIQHLEIEFRISTNDARFIRDELLNRGLVKQVIAGGFSDDGFYDITELGRAYYNKHK